MLSTASLKNIRSKNRHGFTLVELLVTMVISLTLIVLLLRIFNSATLSWQHGEANADSFREARGALQLMARDLSATLSASYAQPTPSGNSLLVKATPLLPTLVLNRYTNFDSAAQPDDPDQHNNEEVYCLTSVPSSAVSGTANPLAGARELCAVGYFCQWLPAIEPYKTNTTHAPHAYGLMRQYLNGDGTFLRFKQARQTAGSGPFDFLSVYTRGPVSLLSPTSTPPADIAQSTLLAAYIWDLKFRIATNLVTSGGQDDGQAVPPKDPANADYDYSGMAPAKPLPPDLPSFVEIRFKAMSANAGRRLEGNTNVAPKDWLPTASSGIYRTLIAPNAQQFVLRVPLTNSVPPPATPTP